MVIEPLVSIHDEILRIRKASAARDHWAVLGIPAGSTYKQIKSAQRKWIRRLHPDKWYASTDERLREEIQEAYYQVQAAYYESLKHCIGSGVHYEPITMPPQLKRTWLERFISFFLHRWNTRSTMGHTA